ncbi:hypothetical protein VOLCADRAFT_100282 [Volvox carteri f. nagariensis]|uniref:YLP motif-containing protein 1 n=1 Tax=Volvox carteri f. nagariensis TaxID=3068 RepID=D8UJW9_VOLCA|nr:uncharacterized protein VOLCADRAFT_100282 [Volvox carteri f. nagariensis]EFJ39985.1 hypothetical protein VOLCADRAFT_100282 [Volvox carteri f. nagariensis]|eukprot:XP_002958950.1 hypothetical protein VOLCADRAFT_100282 [Volvox carteri f. nagariensis]
MFNAYNGQPGNFAAWQTGYGNLQGNYSAPTVPNSYPQPNGFQGPDPYGHYGVYHPQAGWQAPHPSEAYHHQQQQALAQQHYNYQYYSAPNPSPPESLPPLPDAHTAQLQPSATVAAAAAPQAPAPPTPVVVDITRLIRPPHRATRPRKLLLVLRGLPGSGKSTLARKIREAELEAGAEVPRLHSMDDYYMQEMEVEVVEEEGGRKKRRKVTELKYVYEPEMAGTYFRDLVRAVGRSCEDRRHSFVVVDAPVLRAEQLRELMAVGQRANFECFALLPLETDPAVCASPARNVHGHSAASLKEMADSFEPAPPLYAQVSAVSMFGGPVVGEEREADSRGSEIQEVEMDADDSDEDADGGALGAGSDRDDEDGGGAGSRRRRPASRWHDGEGDGAADGARRQRRTKRDKAKLRAMADIDDKGILLGLNDALAADGGGDKAAAGPFPTSGPLNAKRTLGPLKPALRRPLAVAIAVSAAEGKTGSSSQRRVWWPDIGQGNSATAAESITATIKGSSELVHVVYLEGLGPPLEREELPYGYQRRGISAARGEASQGGGGGALVPAPHPGLGPHSHGGSFRDQAKAEHESEHDLFRRLLLGKQGPGATGGNAAAGGASQPGLFAAPLDDDDDDGPNQ